MWTTEGILKFLVVKDHGGSCKAIVCEFVSYARRGAIIMIFNFKFFFDRMADGCERAAHPAG